MKTVELLRFEDRACVLDGSGAFIYYQKKRDL